MKEGWGSLFACGRWTGRWCALRLQSAALDRLAALQLSDSARISRVKYKGEASLLPERPAANQKWRVEKSWNVEGNKRRRCFISLDRGRRNERAGGNATNQIQSCGNEGTCDVRYTRTPPLLNHHAHRAAMECAPNFFGTWTVEKPFKRETGTVLKWSWQRVVGFLLVTLCFSCSMWAIICNVSDPHEFYSWGCLKKAGTHTHVHTFRPEEETVAADECLFITCLQHQRGGASEQDDSGEVGCVVSHTERLRSVLNVFQWRMDVLAERCARENQARCFILLQLWLLFCLFHISDI